jgi:hypothetical protein
MPLCTDHNAGDRNVYRGCGDLWASKLLLFCGGWAVVRALGFLGRADLVLGHLPPEAAVTLLGLVRCSQHPVLG